jgi:hypothetical protein
VRETAVLPGRGEADADFSAADARGCLAVYVVAWVLMTLLPLGFAGGGIGFLKSLALGLADGEPIIYVYVLFSIPMAWIIASSLLSMIRAVVR